MQAEAVRGEVHLGPRKKDSRIEAAGESPEKLQRRDAPRRIHEEVRDTDRGRVGVGAPHRVAGGGLLEADRRRGVREPSGGDPARHEDGARMGRSLAVVRRLHRPAGGRRVVDERESGRGEGVASVSRARREERVSFVAEEGGREAAHNRRRDVRVQKQVAARGRERPAAKREEGAVHRLVREAREEELFGPRRRRENACRHAAGRGPSGHGRDERGDSAAEGDVASGRRRDALRARADGEDRLGQGDGALALGEERAPERREESARGRLVRRRGRSERRRAVESDRPRGAGPAARPCPAEDESRFERKAVHGLGRGSRERGAPRPEEAQREAALGDDRQPRALRVLDELDRHPAALVSFGGLASRGVAPRIREQALEQPVASGAHERPRTAVRPRMRMAGDAPPTATPSPPLTQRPSPFAGCETSPLSVWS